jgi:hypothetical protein
MMRSNSTNWALNPSFTVCLMESYCSVRSLTFRDFYKLTKFLIKRLQCRFFTSCVNYCRSGRVKTYTRPFIDIQTITIQCNEHEVTEASSGRSPFGGTFSIKLTQRKGINVDQGRKLEAAGAAAWLFAISVSTSNVIRQMWWMSGQCIMQICPIRRKHVDSHVQKHTTIAKNSPAPAEVRIVYLLNTSNSHQRLGVPS